jgi:WD40 repeat protein
MKHLLTFENFVPKRQDDRLDKAEELGLVVYPSISDLNISPFGKCVWIFRKEDNYCSITLWSPNFSIGSLKAKFVMTMNQDNTIRHLEFETNRHQNVIDIKFENIKQAEELFDYMSKKWFMLPFEVDLKAYNFSEEDIKAKTKDLLKKAKKLKLEMLDLANSQNLFL